MDKAYLDFDELPPIISKEETLYLFSNFNLENRDKLIRSNLRLVSYEVMHMFCGSDNKLEIFQIGVEGLINAVDHYDITKNFSFSTYAKKCIDNKIIKFLDSKENEIQMESLSKPIITYENNQETLLCETIIGDDDFTDNIDNKDLIRFLLEDLSDRDKKIIILYFGLFDNPRFSQREIAKIIGLSLSGVSYIIKESLRKMRKKMEFEDQKIKRI